MKNIKIKGLEDGDLSKYSIRDSHLDDLHYNNINSGHLKNIAKSGGKAVGKRAHIRLNEAQTSETRKIAASKRKDYKKIKTISIDKDLIISQLKKNYYIKDVADFFDISLSTLRSILKDSNIDKDDYLMKETEEMKKLKYSSFGGSKTNKKILCFFYPSMKPFTIKQFDSIKKANDYFGGGAISKVLSKKQNAIKFNNIKVTFREVEK